MSADGFEALLAEADRRLLVGWDLTYDGRIVSVAPWDFTALVAKQARTSQSLLDIGTGGGEWLAALPDRPARTVAVEGWPPNVPVARRRLEPLGVEVLAFEPAPPNLEQTAGEGAPLPFADDAFDLITSRHEAYLAPEVRRALAPGGTFMTQQVGSGVPPDFRRLLDLPAAGDRPAWDLAFAVRQIEAGGLAVEEAVEGFETMSFADVGAFAWYLKNMPFLLADFSITEARPTLERLHREVVANGPIDVRQPMFWLKARKI